MHPRFNENFTTTEKCDPVLAVQYRRQDPIPTGLSCIYPVAAEVPRYRTIYMYSCGVTLYCRTDPDWAIARQKMSETCCGRMVQTLFGYLSAPRLLPIFPFHSHIFHSRIFSAPIDTLLSVTDKKRYFTKYSITILTLTLIPTREGVK